MNSPMLRQDATRASCYHHRIAYGAKVFGITLRLAGIVLLVVQIVQAVMKISAGGRISTNITLGCLFAILLIFVSRRSVIEKAVAQFAARTRRASSALYIYAFPLLFAVFILWAKIRIGPTSDEWRYVSSEGSLSEYGTAIAYLLVPVFAYPMAKLFRRQNKRLMSSLYWVFIAGTVFIGMEEISWGQRLLGFEEPEFWTKHNVQSEFTFHNFSFYQNHLLHNSFILVGFLGSVCWIGRRYWQARQQRSSALGRDSFLNGKLDISYLLPDWPISSFFYPTFIFYTLIEYTAYGKSGVFLHSADQEHWEFVMSLGVLLFVVINFFRQAKESDTLADGQAEAIEPVMDPAIDPAIDSAIDPAIDRAQP